MKRLNKLRNRLGNVFGRNLFQALRLVERVVHGSSLHLFAPAFSEDPHGQFAKVKNRGPIYYSMTIKAWWVTSFDLVREILHDPHFSSDRVPFGYGIHLCIGASRARLERKVAFTRLLERYSHIELAVPPAWGRNPFFRGFDQLELNTRPVHPAVDRQRLKSAAAH